MDTRLLAEEKRRVGIVICQDIREFEQKSGMRIIGFKFKRDENGDIEELTVKAEIPD